MKRNILEYITLSFIGFIIALYCIGIAGYFEAWPDQPPSILWISIAIVLLVLGASFDEDDEGRLIMYVFSGAMLGCLLIPTAVSESRSSAILIICTLILITWAIYEKYRNKRFIDKNST